MRVRANRASSALTAAAVTARPSLHIVADATAHNWEDTPSLSTRTLVSRTSPTKRRLMAFEARLDASVPMDAETPLNLPIWTSDERDTQGNLLSDSDDDPISDSELSA